MSPSLSADSRLHPRPRRSRATAVGKFFYQLLPANRPERGGTLRPYPEEMIGEDAYRELNIDPDNLREWNMAATARVWERDLSLGGNGLWVDSGDRHGLRVIERQQHDGPSVEDELMGVRTGSAGVRGSRRGSRRGPASRSRGSRRSVSETSTSPSNQPTTQRHFGDGAYGPRQLSQEQLLEQRRIRNSIRQRQELKASGDWLGITGADPLTGKIPVLSPATSGSPDPVVQIGAIPYPLGDMDMSSIGSEHREPVKQDLGLRRLAEANYKSRDMMCAKDKQRREKHLVGLVGRRRGQGRWSSAAEPTLTPITQSPGTMTPLSGPELDNTNDPSAPSHEQSRSLPWNTSIVLNTPITRVERKRKPVSPNVARSPSTGTVIRRGGPVPVTDASKNRILSGARSKMQQWPVDRSATTADVSFLGTEGRQNVAGITAPHPPSFSTPEQNTVQSMKGQENRDTTRIQSHSSAYSQTDHGRQLSQTLPRKQTSIHPRPARTYFRSEGTASGPEMAAVYLNRPEDRLVTAAGQYTSENTATSSLSRWKELTSYHCSMATESSRMTPLQIPSRKDTTPDQDTSMPLSVPRALRSFKDNDLIGQKANIGIVNGEATSEDLVRVHPGTLDAENTTTRMTLKEAEHHRQETRYPKTVPNALALHPQCHHSDQLCACTLITTITGYEQRIQSRNVPCSNQQGRMGTGQCSHTQLSRGLRRPVPYLGVRQIDTLSRHHVAIMPQTSTATESDGTSVRQLTYDMMWQNPAQSIEMPGQFSQGEFAATPSNPSRTVFSAVWRYATSQIGRWLTPTEINTGTSATTDEDETFEQRYHATEDDDNHQIDYEQLFDGNGVSRVGEDLRDGDEGETMVMYYGSDRAARRARKQLFKEIEKDHKRAEKQRRYARRLCKAQFKAYGPGYELLPYKQDRIDLCCDIARVAILTVVGFMGAWWLAVEPVFYECSPIRRRIRAGRTTWTDKMMLALTVAFMVTTTVLYYWCYVVVQWIKRCFW